jgi:dephospho-CoA kinase
MPPIGREFEDRTYRGIGPHAADLRAARAAAALASLIEERIHGVRAEHVGSTAVPGLAGKNVIDLQITAEPSDVPRLTKELLGLGFERQRGRDPWPPERPMLEGTYRWDGAVLLVHCHVVPTTDPDVEQMIAFRDLLRGDVAARTAYEAEKRRIAATTDDSLDYTNAKTAVIRRLLGR